MKAPLRDFTDFQMTEKMLETDLGLIRVMDN